MTYRLESTAKFQAPKTEVERALFKIATVTTSIWAIKQQKLLGKNADIGAMQSSTIFPDFAMDFYSDLRPLFACPRIPAILAPSVHSGHLISVQIQSWESRLIQLA